MSDLGCSQPGCPVRATGKCLEGFEPPDKCSFFVTGAEVPAGQVETGSVDFVDLPSGEALSQEQAGETARDGVSKVIIVAGPYGSGKTTILTALYEAFLEAPFANFLFRGSRTLVGFERRCHLAREESGQISPDTSHTSVREGVVFLHLELAVEQEESLDCKHILLSDISGELFKRLRDSSDAIVQLSALRRADHLCLVLDGEKIAHLESRHNARNDSRSILRSIVEAKVLSNDVIIDVAFTKWDLVVQALKQDAASVLEDYIKDTKDALRRTAPQFTLRFHEVAARPTKSTVAFAHGLPTLLRSWFGTNETERRKPQISITKTPLREMGRFTDAVIEISRMGGNFDVRSL